jgi:ABC-2 type transport system ATP-binding protein
MKSVDIKNLTRTFGSFTAVNGITFSVEKSEVFGFLGPNGAGKTTTIRMLCGILKPTSGEGTVNGLDIIQENEKIKGQIGYMSQKFSLYRDLNVEENIDFYAGIYGVRGGEHRGKKKWALEITGLAGAGRKLVRELPAGYKQKLALVCSLLHRPPIIFLDEPTAGVDPVSRRQFWDLIYHLKSAENTTVFVTTHYMDEAEHCERIGLIQSGSLAAIGSPQELKQRIKDAVYVIHGSPFFMIRQVLEKERSVTNIVPFGSSFHAFLDDAGQAVAVRKTLEKAGVEVSRFEKVVPSLEDVFLRLVDK